MAFELFHLGSIPDSTINGHALVFRRPSANTLIWLSHLLLEMKTIQLGGTTSCLIETRFHGGFLKSRSLDYYSGEIPPTLNCLFPRRYILCLLFFFFDKFEAQGKNKVMEGMN